MIRSIDVFNETITILNELSKLIDTAIARTLSIDQKLWNEFTKIFYKWNQILIYKKNQVFTCCPPHMILVIRNKYQAHLAKITIFHILQRIRYKRISECRKLKIKYGY